MEKRITDRMLLDYFDGKISAEDSLCVERWIAKSTANRERAQMISTVGFLLDASHGQREDGAKAALAKIRSTIRYNRIRAFGGVIQRAAAVVAVPLLIASVYMLTMLGEQKNTFIEVKSNTGMVSEVVLPDNTTVWLNSNSTLRYPERFSGKQRRVSLTGEAYFDVAADASRKFVVEAKNTEIEVYGTQFNVEAYEDNDDIHTVLVSGSVGFRYTDTGGERVLVKLTPGQHIIYNSPAQYATMRVENTDVSTSWKEGKILLRNTPLEDALRIIGNRYNVAFKLIDRKLAENTYVGTFSNQTLDAVLKYFSLSSEINFRPVPLPHDGEYAGREIIEVY